MKKIYLFIAITFINLQVFSQNNNGLDITKKSTHSSTILKKRMIVDYYISKLNMDENQSRRFEKVFFEFDEKIKKFISNKDNENYKDDFNYLLKQEVSKYYSILNIEQFRKFKILRKEKEKNKLFIID